MAKVAQLIGVHSDTLGRVAKALAAKKPPPRTRNAYALPVGALFFDPDVGVQPSIYARALYQALEIDPAQTAGPPLVEPSSTKTKKIFTRNRRIPSLSMAALNEMSPADLEAELESTLKRAKGAAGGLTPIEALTRIVTVLAKHGHGRQLRVHGQQINPRRFAQLGTFDSFLSKGRSDDRWLFVLPRLKSKPVEIFAASPLELRYGQIVALTFKQWAGLMQEALAYNARIRATAGEGRKIEKVIEKGMKRSPSDSGAKRRVRVALCTRG